MKKSVLVSLIAGFSLAAAGTPAVVGICENNSSNGYDHIVAAPSYDVFAIPCLLVMMHNNTGTTNYPMTYYYSAKEYDGQSMWHSHNINNNDRAWDYGWSGYNRNNCLAVHVPYYESPRPGVGFWVWRTMVFVYAGYQCAATHPLKIDIYWSEATTDTQVANWNKPIWNKTQVIAPNVTASGWDLDISFTNDGIYYNNPNPHTGLYPSYWVTKF